MKRRKKRIKTIPIKSKINSHGVIGGILITCGAILLMIWGTHRIIIYQSLHISNTLLSTFAPAATYQTHITNIRIGKTINLPVIESGYINGKWLIAPNKANHVSQSAGPGTTGNIIIYAHNTDALFGPLRLVTKGDRIYLSTNTGSLYQYVVSQITEVNPNNTMLLKPTITEALTLYTCSGLFDSKRLVVRAVPEIQK